MLTEEGVCEGRRGIRPPRREGEGSLLLIKGTFPSRLSSQIRTLQITVGRGLQVHPPRSTAEPGPRPISPAVLFSPSNDSSFQAFLRHNCLPASWLCIPHMKTSNKPGGRLRPDLFPCDTGASANPEVGSRSHVQFLEMLPQHKQLNSTKLPGMCAQWLHFLSS